jgi:hypothetical protein
MIVENLSGSAMTKTVMPRSNRESIQSSTDLHEPDEPARDPENNSLTKHVSGVNIFCQAAIPIQAGFRRKSHIV